MRHSLVMPSSWRGWLVLGGFVLVIAAGIWPVIGWVNRSILILGIPALAVWSYLIIFLCCAVMVIGNRLIENDDD